MLLNTIRDKVFASLSVYIQLDTCDCVYSCGNILTYVFMYKVHINMMECTAEYIYMSWWHHVCTSFMYYCTLSDVYIVHLHVYILHVSMYIYTIEHFCMYTSTSILYMWCLQANRVISKTSKPKSSVYYYTQHKVLYKYGLPQINQFLNLYSSRHASWFPRTY